MALMGAILVSGLAEQAGAGGPLAGMSVSGILHGGPAAIAALPEATRQAIVASFAVSYRYVYIAGAGICILGFALAFFIKELPLRWRGAPAPATPEAARPATRARSAADRVEP